MLGAPDNLPEEVRSLLQQTVIAFVSPTARVVGAASLPIGAGLSGAAVRRYQLTLVQAEGTLSQVRLVTKETHLRERRVLTRLVGQRQKAIPFSHTLDLTSDGSARIAMQDVGDTRRPTSLEPITSEQLRREAEGLAGIHMANLGRAELLDWLPPIDRIYFAEQVLEGWWRPHWEEAQSEPAFRQEFHDLLGAVEAAAEVMVAEMTSVAGEPECLTLIHTDINPSNVLVHHGQPYYIDWQVAHYGPLYLDLPHHFCTRAQAEHYRRALAALGLEIPRDQFAVRFRAAARCIGFRYLWWTLKDWRPAPRETAWVHHYLRLILGQV
jgi:hypothetical protein